MFLRLSSSSFLIFFLERNFGNRFSLHVAEMWRRVSAVTDDQKRPPASIMPDNGGGVLPAHAFNWRLYT
jgi:hypothetical protein